MNETNEMWRGYKEEMRLRSRRAADRATQRIVALEKIRKLVAIWRTDYQVTLWNPDRTKLVDFYPTRGTIVRDNLRQTRRGLDAALKLIGVVE
jgi:hypothetical protein